MQVSDVQILFAYIAENSFNGHVAADKLCDAILDLLNLSTETAHIEEIQSELV